VPSWRAASPVRELAYMGTADLTREHLPPFQLLAPGQRASGWIAADMLSMKEQPDGYAWLASHTPVTRVGKSIDLTTSRRVSRLHLRFPAPRLHRAACSCAPPAHGRARVAMSTPARLYSS